MFEHYNAVSDNNAHQTYNAKHGGQTEIQFKDQQTGKCPEETQERLKRIILHFYRGRTVEFETKVDPAIIGGGILGMGYWRVDASVAGQLKKVKQQFIEKNRRIV